MGETTDTRRKRLLYRSWHRGLKEADLLLGSFAERHLDGFTPAELDQWEALLGENDADLLDWIFARRPPPPPLDGAVQRLRHFRYQPRPA